MLLFNSSLAGIGSVVQSKKENFEAKGVIILIHSDSKHANELVSVQKANSLTTIDLILLQSAAK